MTDAADSSLKDVNLADIVSAERTARSRPHEVWSALRRESPVHWCEIEGYDPFWAVTRHADIRYVSTHPEIFSSQGQLVLESAARRAEANPIEGAKSVMNTDPPEHKAYRDMAAPYFRPRPLKQLEDRVHEISRVLLDQYTADGPVELDFATDIASWHPLKMIATLVGAKESQEPIILRMSNEIFGDQDPEFVRDRSELFAEVFAFLYEVLADKRANPGDDISTVLVNSTLNGEPVSDLDLAMYLMILISAGHDTTRLSLAGGMAALMDNPEQLQMLRDDPSLIPTAADEIIRYSTPVMHFMRTAAEDCEIAGQPIAKGDAVVMYYASGNFDETVFDDPHAFRVARNPNAHLAFGVGEHYCMGAALARMEIRAMLEELIPRLVSVEPAGERKVLASTYVSGIKHLPIRWTLRPAAAT